MVSNYFYFCEKYRAILENRVSDEFDIKLVRLEYL